MGGEGRRGGKRERRSEAVGQERREKEEGKWKGNG